MKFVCTKEGWKHKVLSYNQVKDCINTLYPGTILPVNIDNPELLAMFNITKLKEIFVEDENDIELRPYYNYTPGIPYQDLNGVWCLEWETSVDSNRLDDTWGLLRLTRNKLLLDTDWIEHSVILTEECRLKYFIYRQLLRDCLNIVNYPHEVILPVVPALVYISSFTRIDKPELIYDDIELEAIKSYKPEDKELSNWNLFLKEWSKVKFTNNQRYVNNLISLYTNIDYETIF